MIGTLFLCLESTLRVPFVGAEIEKKTTLGTRVVDLFVRIFDFV